MRKPQPRPADADDTLLERGVYLSLSGWWCAYYLRLNIMRTPDEPRTTEYRNRFRTEQEAIDWLRARTNGTTMFDQD